MVTVLACAALFLVAMLALVVGAGVWGNRARRDAHARGLRAAQRIHGVSSRARQAMQAEAWRLKHGGK